MDREIAERIGSPTETLVCEAVWMAWDWNPPASREEVLKQLCLLADVPMREAVERLDAAMEAGEVRALGFTLHIGLIASKRGAGAEVAV